MKDFLEIGYWRQRSQRVERVLRMVETLELDSTVDAHALDELADAVRAVRDFDAAESPWQHRERARVAV